MKAMIVKLWACMYTFFKLLDFQAKACDIHWWHLMMRWDFQWHWCIFQKDNLKAHLSHIAVWLQKKRVHVLYFLHSLTVPNAECVEAFKGSPIWLHNMCLNTCLQNERDKITSETLGRTFLNCFFPPFFVFLITCYRCKT